MFLSDGEVGRIRTYEAYGSTRYPTPGLDLAQWFMTPRPCHVTYKRRFTVAHFVHLYTALV